MARPVPSLLAPVRRATRRAAEVYRWFHQHRSYADATRRLLLAEIARVARRDARSPAAYDDPAWTDRLAARFVDLLGRRHVRVKRPSLGGEDFGEFSRAPGIPGVIWKLGTSAPSALRRGPAGVPGRHSDRFAPRLGLALETGIATIVAAVQESTAR